MVCEGFLGSTQFSLPSKKVYTLRVEHLKLDFKNLLLVIVTKKFFYILRLEH